MKSKQLIIFSGLLWLGMGIFLLSKGLKLIVGADVGQTAYLLMGGGLLVGHLKGKYVLSKTVTKISGRAKSQERVKLSHVYPRSYLFLIFGMMALGMGLRYLGLPGAVHGFIDTAIGAALIQGGRQYFHHL